MATYSCYGNAPDNYVMNSDYQPVLPVPDTLPKRNVGNGCPSLFRTAVVNIRVQRKLTRIEIETSDRFCSTEL